MTRENNTRCITASLYFYSVVTNRSQKDDQVQQKDYEKHVIDSILLIGFTSHA